MVQTNDAYFNAPVVTEFQVLLEEVTRAKPNTVQLDDHGLFG